MLEVGDVLIHNGRTPTLNSDAATTWDAHNSIELLCKELGFRRWNGPTFLGHVRGRRLELKTLPLLLHEIRPEIAEGVVELFIIGERSDVLAARTQVREAITALIGQLGLRWLVSVGLPCIDAHRAWDLAEVATLDEVPVQNIECLLDRWNHGGPPAPEDFDEVADCGCEGPHLLEDLGVRVAGVEEPWSSWCRVRPGRIARAVAFAQKDAPDQRRSPVGAGAPTAVQAP